MGNSIEPEASEQEEGTGMYSDSDGDEMEELPLVGIAAPQETYIDEDGFEMPLPEFDDENSCSVSGGGSSLSSHSGTKPNRVSVYVAPLEAAALAQAKAEQEAELAQQRELAKLMPTVHDYSELGLQQLVRYGDFKVWSLNHYSFSLLFYFTFFFRKRYYFILFILLFGSAASFLLFVFFLSAWFRSFSFC
jgi:hypothetical protein